MTTRSLEPGTLARSWLHPQGHHQRVAVRVRHLHSGLLSDVTLAFGDDKWAVRLFSVSVTQLVMNHLQGEAPWPRVSDVQHRRLQPLLHLAKVVHLKTHRDTIVSAKTITDLAQRLQGSGKSHLEDVDAGEVNVVALLGAVLEEVEREADVAGAAQDPGRLLPLAPCGLGHVQRT